MVSDPIRYENGRQLFNDSHREQLIRQVGILWDDVQEQTKTSSKDRIPKLFSGAKFIDPVEVRKSNLLLGNPYKRQSAASTPPVTASSTALSIPSLPEKQTKAVLDIFAKTLAVAPIALRPADAEPRKQQQPSDECIEDERKEKEKLLLKKMQMAAMPTLFAMAMQHFTREAIMEHKRAVAKRKIFSREDIAMGVGSNQQKSVGDQRLRKLRWVLNNMGFQRSADQMKFHDDFTQAILPILYDKEWDTCSSRVMREFKIKELMSECLCMTPRRFGKSYAVAMFAAACLLVIPGVSIAVFSPGSRASNSLMKLVRKFIHLVPGGDARVLGGGGTEHLYITAHALAEGVGATSHAARNMQILPTTSHLMCFPSSKKGQSYNINKKQIKHTQISCHRHHHGSLNLSYFCF